MEKQEQFLYGEILTPPLFKWKNHSETDVLMTGWECEVQTNSAITGDPVVITVQICYDFVKWNYVKQGDMVKLSVLGKMTSKTSKTGESLKCNVVIRK